MQKINYFRELDNRSRYNETAGHAARVCSSLLKDLLRSQRYSVIEKKARVGPSLLTLIVKDLGLCTVKSEVAMTLPSFPLLITFK